MPSVHELAGGAGFVFEGEVQALGQSTAPGYTASGETAVVRVTKILKGPAALSGYVGQPVTVELQGPANLAAGQSAVFFTHGIHYGEGLVVRELGNVPPRTEVESQVNEAAEAQG